MIISRTPLRISLGGGGTDLPSYYEKHGGGFLIAAAINKHIYISLHDNFSENLLLKYSKIEDVDNLEKVEHPIIREALRMTGVKSAVEISSMADIPAGTGLGSSGTFTVGLLKALSAYTNQITTNHEIAENACRIEIDLLNEPVGKQDQYIAALGGLTALEFNPDGSVNAEPVRMESSLRNQIEENLILFYTGIKRSASEELFALDTGISADEKSISDNLQKIKQIGYNTLNALESGNLDAFGKALSEQWKLKYERSPSALHSSIDSQIQVGISEGALGGKLIGAGGGGFLMFYAENKGGLRKRMKELGLREITFKFDYLGSQIIQ